MLKPAKIRGVLLEEAMLHLLKAAGYLPIYGKGTDETLKKYGMLSLLAAEVSHQPY
ncbi:MAG: hypothetical protein MPW16_01955 [Candidatus Manganitrophus sp.]|nr:MAG: hypothetical protein MPW16_01955 [Candidatus Manganitrophus sp.]